jgi:GWxTD domain-containing protein
MALGLLVGPVAHAERIDERGPLPWREGGRIGFTLDSAAFPDSGGFTLDLFVRIPPSTLDKLARDTSGIRKLMLTAQVRNSAPPKTHRAQRILEISPADTANTFGKVIVLRFPTRPGTQKVSVKLEDSLSKKVGLVYHGKVLESAKVEGQYQVSFPRNGIHLSEPEFVWSEVGPVTNTVFSRSGAGLLPNPERLYGEYARELKAYFEARVASDAPRTWHWSARVLDAKGVLLAKQDSTAEASGLAALATFDVSKYPAGSYTLEIVAGTEGETDVTRKAPFSIGWKPETWFTNPRDILDIVHLLLTSDPEDAFALMQPGEQERFMEEFWLKRDPTPGTPRNERREEFLHRVAQADQIYGRYGLHRGMFSDMGRVYIRYGEPTEIYRQVIPAGDQTLLQAVRALDLSEDRPVGDVEQKGPGGDMRPYEVWVYDGMIPPPPDAEPEAMQTRRRRLVFLFVDEQGLGDYTLRYSTE